MAGPGLKGERAQHASSSLSSLISDRNSDSIVSSVSAGHDPKHAISITPTESVHSSFHSSDRVSVPDMGPAARGGHMQDKAGREARARAPQEVINHISATQLPLPEVEQVSMTPDIPDEEVRMNQQNVLVARSLLSTGLAVDQLITDQLVAEADRTNICTAGELNDARLGYSHYFLREPITLLDEACLSVESPVLRHMLDVVGAVLSTGPRWSEDSDVDVWTMLPPGDWFRVCTFITAATTRGCLRTSDVWKMGKFAGLIGTEKTKAYNKALDGARSEALKEARATATKEAAQKGRSYEKMLLSRAEDEAKVTADREFKSHLMSERSKIALRVEAEIKVEHSAVLEERRRNLVGCLAEMSQVAEVEFIRENAVRLGLLGDSGSTEPTPSKRAKVTPAPRTAAKARAVARSRTASVSSAHAFAREQFAP
jgi:hypothetical protein